MALPVSIGDAILLSQLAFRLGKSLTAGRKSAPATHKEAQNQLFALSQALRSITIKEDAEILQRSGVSHERNDGSSQDLKGLHDEEQSKNLEAMIGNFEDVLERLRAPVMSMDWIGYENRFKSNPNIGSSLLTGHLNRINQINQNPNRLYIFRLLS